MGWEATLWTSHTPGRSRDVVVVYCGGLATLVPFRVIWSRPDGKPAPDLRVFLP